MGREGSHYGIDEYLELKYMTFGGLDVSAEAIRPQAGWAPTITTAIRGHSSE
jgi:hypothetical protein